MRGDTTMAVKPPLHPDLALFREEAATPVIPAVDHYAGTDKTMGRALQLQARLPVAFDVTLDLEDGAPTGAESAQRELIVEFLRQPRTPGRAVGVRIHDVSSPHWRADIDVLMAGAGDRIEHLTLPKVPGAAQAAEMIKTLQSAARIHGLSRPIPVHVLIETPGAVRDAWNIAALPWVRGLDFGTMDFVSAHGGALGSECMRSPAQFEHALMRRAKAELSAAALAHGRVPVHGVCVAFRDRAQTASDAQRARQEFGFLRMWSVHPDQIEPIQQAFAPALHEVQQAARTLLAGSAAHWAPVSVDDVLHDRASYRWAWCLLRRARLAGVPVGAEAEAAFFANSQENPSA